MSARLDCASAHNLCVISLTLGHLFFTKDNTKKERRGWINSCFCLETAAGENSFPGTFLGRQGAKKRPLFTFQPAHLEPTYIYLRQIVWLRTRNRGWDEMGRVTHRSIQPFLSCLLVSHFLSLFFKGWKHLCFDLWCSVGVWKRGERIDDGWQREVDSLIKYGLIGMGFSFLRVYLL